MEYPIVMAAEGGMRVLSIEVDARYGATPTHIYRVVRHDKAIGDYESMHEAASVLALRLPRPRR